MLSYTVTASSLKNNKPYFLFFLPLVHLFYASPYFKSNLLSNHLLQRGFLKSSTNILLFTLKQSTESKVGITLGWNTR